MARNAGEGAAGLSKSGAKKSTVKKASHLDATPFALAGGAG